jgi:hypothetical protein
MDHSRYPGISMDTVGDKVNAKLDTGLPVGLVTMWSFKWPPVHLMFMNSDR